MTIYKKLDISPSKWNMKFKNYQINLGFPSIDNQIKNHNSNNQITNFTRWNKANEPVFIITLFSS